jgi:hypothetical protein
MTPAKNNLQTKTTISDKDETGKTNEKKNSPKNNTIPIIISGINIFKNTIMLLENPFLIRKKYSTKNLTINPHATIIENCSRLPVWIPSKIQNTDMPA